MVACMRWPPPITPLLPLLAVVMVWSVGRSRAYGVPGSERTGPWHPSVERRRRTQRTAGAESWLPAIRMFPEDNQLERKFSSTLNPSRDARAITVWVSRQPEQMGGTPNVP